MVIETRLSTNECTGAQRRATILNRHGVPHDTVLLSREDFPFRQDARSCAAQLGWSAGGEMLAVLPHRCRSIVLWRAITLESQAFEIAHKVLMHRNVRWPNLKLSSHSPDMRPLRPSEGGNAARTVPSHSYTAGNRHDYSSC